MKTYNLIKNILIKYKETRNCDKTLQWKIWERQGVVKNGFISEFDYIKKAKHFETIRRTRQKIQERHPELRANFDTEEYREAKQATQGTWIFRDNIAQFIRNQPTLL